MIVERIDLDIAVAEGIVSRDQALRLQDLARRHAAEDRAALDFTQDPRDEPFRMFRGFRDVFLAIAVVILAVGLTVAAGQIAGFEQVIGGKFHFNAGFAPIFATAFLCLCGIGLAEIITHRLRLPLASIAITLAFALWAAMFFGAVASFWAFGWGSVTERLSAAQTAIGMVAWAMCVGAILGTVVFYRFYGFPFALFVLAASFVLLIFAMLEDAFGDLWFVGTGRAVFAAGGIAVFAAAMWFDVRDRLRLTRLSECGFWLHLVAAPMFVHALLLSDGSYSPGLPMVFGTMIALSLVALLIDRRALLVAGLGYVAAAISDLVSSSAAVFGLEFAATAVLLGIVLVGLGLGWTPLRARLLRAVPFEGLKAKLPPAAA